MSDMIDPDILVTRVVDGRDTASDWRALESLASADPQVWRTLAQAQRDHRAMSREVRAQTAIAAHVSAPVHVLGRAGAPAVGEREAMSRRTRDVSTWAGWAAAAAIALAFVGRVGVGHGVNAQPVGQGARRELEGFDFHGFRRRGWGWGGRIRTGGKNSGAEQNGHGGNT